MGILRLAAVMGAWTVVSLAGCSGSDASFNPGTDGGGNPSTCPSEAPSTGAPCSTSGLACSYGCNVQATCDGQKWTVAELAIPCPVDAGVSDDGSGACASNSDCHSGFSCSPGGESVGCGICFQPPNACNTDSDCKIIDDAAATKPYVCGPGEGCECGIGGKTGECIPACAGPGDCTPDEACSSGHCVAKPCSSDSECPSPSTVDYACVSGACGVKPCTSNADCGAHYCVNGSCYPEAGSCVPPAA